MNIFYIFILYMMTSVVDKYYRKIAQDIDNVTMKFDISSLLVKSNEHDSKIENNETNISSNLTKIENSETNISFNLTKIDDNETNVSSNVTKIGTNETNISSNLEKLILFKKIILKYLIVFLMINTILKSNYLVLIKIHILICYFKKFMNMILIQMGN